eukprot:1085015-Amphidinium_carterae.2
MALRVPFHKRRTTRQALLQSEATKAFGSAAWRAVTRGRSSVHRLSRPSQPGLNEHTLPSDLTKSPILAVLRSRCTGLAPRNIALGSAPPSPTRVPPNPVDKLRNSTQRPAPLGESTRPLVRGRRPIPPR